MVKFMRKFILCTLVLCGALLARAQVTILVTSQGSGLSSQTWFTSGSQGEMRTNDIKNHWNYGRYITSAAHTSNGWFIAMSKGMPWTNQSYQTSTTWPDSYVQGQKKQGYMITSMAASDSGWLVVTSEGSNITDQQICSAPWSSLSGWIKGWWDKNYYITSIACQNSLWTVVMSKGSGVKYTAQSYFTSTTTSDLGKKIKEKWDDGYRITAMEYGNGTYFCIMSKFPGSATDMQSYNINTDFEAWEKEKSKDGYVITYIGG